MYLTCPTFDVKQLLGHGHRVIKPSGTKNDSEEHSEKALMGKVGAALLDGGTQARLSERENNRSRTNDAPDCAS